MSSRGHFVWTMAAALLPAGAAQAEISIGFGLRLESPEFKDLDTSLAIDGLPGSEHRFTASMVITTSGVVG